jgi:acyl-ACP thioesterase
MTQVKDNIIFVTGYAKLPQGITATELYTVIAVGMLIDRDTGIIEDVDCSLVTSVARTFVKDLVVGKNILDLEALDKTFTSRYHGSARKALLSAFKIINEKYANILKNQENQDE